MPSNSLGVRMFVSDATEAAQYALLREREKEKNEEDMWVRDREKRPPCIETHNQFDNEIR